MTEFTALPADLLLAWSAYALGTASPGPSNLTVMATAMQAGRRSALLVAIGVVAGSTIWGLLAAFGLAALFAQWAGALAAIKVLGGLYLLWLARRAGCAALSTQPYASGRAAAGGAASSLLVQGAAMHLTNPKAILTWIAIVALALPAGSEPRQALLVVAGCVPIGLAVFGSYALLFSTALARRLYARLRRGIEAALAVTFGCAGLRLLTAR